MEKRTDLERELLEVALEGFNRPATKSFRDDVASHIRSGFLQVALSDQKPVAFAVSQLYPEKGAAYLAGLVKKPSAPSALVEGMVGQFIDQFDPTILITRTQNDRVMEIMCRFCPRVVPLDRLATPEEVELLTELGLMGEMTNPDLLITRGHYGSQMILDSQRRRSFNKRVTNFSDRLNYQAGDAALLIGYRKKYEK